MRKFVALFLMLVAINLLAQDAIWCPQRIVRGDPRNNGQEEQMLAQDMQRRMAQSRTASMSTPGIGTLTLPPRVLVIMVNFNDYQFSTDKAHADSIFNATTPLTTDRGSVATSYGEEQIVSHGSVAQYFEDQSLGKYRPKFDVVGPVTINKSYTAFPGSSYGGTLANLACTAVNDSVDFTLYDQDNDGYIDLVFLFFAGFGQNDKDYIDTLLIPKTNVSKLIWPHYSKVSSGTKFDGKTLRAYECSNELDGYYSQASPKHLVPAGSGILVHEFSHGMGLPDVYCVNTQYMGAWDLMDYGCYNGGTYIPASYTGYERWFCGWSQPKMMNCAKNDTLRPISMSGDFGVISANGTVSGPNSSTEYWIIENRQRKGWDAYASGEGLIMYRMQYHSYWGTSTNASNKNGCILLPADSTLRNDGYVGKQGDCYPYNGLDSIKIASNYPITAIKQEENGDITLRVCGDADATYTRGVMAGQWGTICLPWPSINMFGATFYNVLGRNNDNMVVRKVKHLEAGKPYLFHAEGEQIRITYHPNQEVYEPISYNGIIGIFEDRSLNKTYWVLSNNQLFCALAGSTILAKRAYFDLRNMPISTLESNDSIEYIAIHDLPLGGKCGDNLTWEYICHTLSIEGTGEIYDYTATTTPWEAYKEQIVSIEIGDSVTSIGDYAFAGCTAVSSLTCNALVPPTCGTNSFDGVPASALLKVPETSEYVYTQTDVWKEFINIFRTVYSVEVRMQTEQKGTSIGSGNYFSQSSVTIAAIANIGYHFTQWSDGVIDNPRTFTITQDTTFTAEFAINQYEVIFLNWNDTALQTMTVDYGSAVSYKGDVPSKPATAQYTYTFKGWDPAIVSPVDEDAAYTALFDSVLNSYTVTTAAENGTITGAGTYQYGTEVALTATGNTGYHFSQWSDGNTDNPRSVRLTQDTTFAATFEKITSGKCGDNLLWQYLDGTLSIYGKGAMYNYTASTAPWLLFRDSIINLVFSDGVTTIGNYAFYGFENEEFDEVNLPNNIKTIGQYAFAGCKWIYQLTMGTELREIYDYAFANTMSLLHITCYRVRPALLADTVFSNLDAYIIVPCEGAKDYKIAPGWKKFNQENVTCIGADTIKEVVKGSVKVEPADNTATITWPKDEEASTYDIVIKKDGVVFCTLTFDGKGQLTGIAFAPSRGAQALCAQDVQSGYRFTVTSLNPATTYGFDITSKDKNEQTISAYDGEFTTTGSNVVTDLDNAPCTMHHARKVMINGQLYIQRDGKVYNAIGGEVK